MARNKSTKLGSLPERKVAAQSQPADPPFSKSLLRDLFERNSTLLSLLIFLLVAWAFLPSIRNDFLYWYGDDPGYVTENVHVQKGLTLEGAKWAFRNIDLGNWHPLTFLSHMLDGQLYGLKPWGHHLTSVLIHAVNAVLVFLVLRRMTGAVWRSLAVALLFGLHPLRAESVAWVAERKDVLAAFFWMVTMWFYARYAEESKGQSPKSKVFYILSLAGFAGGLMSKGIVVTLPFALLLLDYWPLKRHEQKSFAKLFLEKVPFIALAVATSAITFVAQKNWGFVQTAEKYSLLMRLENAMVSYARYVGKMFWPVDLCGFYPHPGKWPLGIVLFAVVFVVGISVTAIVFRRARPWLGVGWFWYLGTLVPVIGIVQLGDVAMADRYSYIPMIGFLVALVWGWLELTKKWKQQIALASAALVATLVFCTALTLKQITYFKDSVALWRHNFEVTGNVDVAQFALGLSLDKQGQTEEGAKELQAVLRVKPERADVHYNLGTMLDDLKRIDEAIFHYSEAVRIAPDYNDALFNLAQDMVRQGRFEEAIVQFQKSLQLTNDSRAYVPLGQAFASVGRLTEAAELIQKALKTNPSRYDYHLDLAKVLRLQKRMVEATQHCFEAVKLAPHESVAQFRLGLLLHEQGRVDESLPFFRQAARLNKEKPYDPEMNDVLCGIFASENLIDDLIESLKTSVKHIPSDSRTQANLGYALTAKGLTNEGIRHLEEAIRLDPKFDDAIIFLDSMRRTGNATVQ